MTTAYVLLEPGTEQPALVTVVPGAGEAALWYLCSHGLRVPHPELPATEKW